VYAATNAWGTPRRYLDANVTTVRDPGGFGTLVCGVAKAVADSAPPGPWPVGGGGGRG
jgi:hypothetical protein